MGSPEFVAAVGWNRAIDRFTVAGFVLVLLLPTADLFVRDDVARGPGPELRRPAPAPKWPRSGAAIVDFPRDYEAYWNDSFGLRDVMLRGHSVVKILGLGTAPDRTHVIGREDWVYNDNNRLLDSWRGAIPFRTEELEAWRRSLERRRDHLAAAGAHYLFVIVPDKPQIYPEYVPERFTRVGPSRMDQFFGHLADTSDVDVLDLRPALLEEKRRDAPDDSVYYRFGTHWQMRGAIAGYNAIARHLQSRFPTISEQPLEGHRLEGGVEFGDSEYRNMYVGDLFPQQDRFLVIDGPRRAHHVANTAALTLRVTEVDDPALPRIVMFHDSFAPYFENHWSEAASRLVMVDSKDMDFELIARERPNLVIEVYAERVLEYRDPRHPNAATPTGHLAKFLVARRRVATLDVAAPGRTLRPLFRAIHRSRVDATGTSAELATVDQPDSFQVLGLPALSNCAIAVRVDIEYESPGGVGVNWKTVAEPGWVGTNAVVEFVGAGRHVIYLSFELGASPLEALIFNPLQGGGRCRLHALEVRAQGE